MPLFKNVNGVEVELSPEEETAMLAEWAANEAAPAPVPPRVTAGQFIRALDQLDLLSSVDAAVAQADALTQRLWDRASLFERADPMISGIAAALNKTSGEIDDVFRLAATF